MEVIARRHGIENLEDIPVDVIVEDAKNQRSPLHKYFVWNVERALELFWATQARTLVNHLRIEIEYSDGSMDTIHAYKNVSIEYTIAEEIERRRSYVPIQTLVANPNLLDQVFEDVYKRFKYWAAEIERYDPKNFAIIADAIQRYEEGRNRRKPPKSKTG